MRFACVTLFPEMFAAITESGISGRAVKSDLMQLSCINPRDFTQDKHRTVDDRPYGGGPGMLMLAEPLSQAIQAAKSSLSPAARVIYLSPQGQKLDQSQVERLRQYPELVLVCGRYEGIDERVINSQVDEEISIGDFVLSGGELAAMVLVDALVRGLPEVLGHAQSAEQDSFVEGLLDHPHYTRPEVFADMPVPEVLLSGNHAAIKRWRLKQALGRTWLRRADLLEKIQLTDEQTALLEEFKFEHKQNTRLT